ncbi:MAG TPA: SET domain-containing protein [Wenzhouxiangella sp.]|nr:SET domain-containing protein [Wenzhouxiangella sp.]
MKAKKKNTRGRFDDNPLAYVAESPIHGRGLFARVPIDVDEYIGTYTGKRTQTNGMHVLWLWNEKRGRWEGIDGNNEMRFLNHDDEPNADWWGEDLYAIRSIATDEEITFDYGWNDEEE